MLILLSTVQANKVDDNLYTGITLDDNALHSSKGIIEYSINKLITRQMLLDMLKLQKKAFIGQYNNVKDIKNWYPPSNFWCEGIDAKDIHIGVDGVDCNILTLDGEGNPVTEDQPTCQILVAYIDRDETVLSYLVSEYNVETKEYEINRKVELDIISDIDNGEKIYSNAMTEFNEDGEEQLKPVGFGFVREIDTKNAARLQKIKATKRAASKLTKDTTGFTHDTVLRDQFESASQNILDFLEGDEGGACTKEQKEFLAKYYSWYLKRAFELIIGNSKVKISVNKKAALDALKISKDSNWEFSGCAYSRSMSLHCSDPSCNHALKKAYVFEATTDDGPIELYFGLNCAQAFFDINSNDLDTMQESVAKSEAEIKELFNAYLDTKSYDGMTNIESRIYKQQLFRDSVNELRESDALETIYGDSAPWLCGFIDQNLPIPDSLNTLIITSFVRRSAKLTENVNQTTPDDKKKKEENDNTNLRKRVLNATIPDSDIEFKEEDFRYYWMHRNPEYSDIIKYFPESKIYFDFMYKYKLFSIPMTDAALENFNKKHTSELKAIAWTLSASDFTADELGNVMLLLKTEKVIHDKFEQALRANGINLYDSTLDLESLLLFIFRKFRYKFSTTIRTGIGLYKVSYAPYTYFTAMLRPYIPAVGDPPTHTEGGRKTTILRKSPKYRLIADPNDLYQNLRSGIAYDIFTPNDRRNYYVTKLDTIAEKHGILKDIIMELQSNFQKYDDFILKDVIPSLKAEVAQNRKRKFEREEQERKKREKEAKYRRLIAEQKGKKFLNVTLEEIYAHPVYQALNYSGEGLVASLYDKISNYSRLTFFYKRNIIFDIFADKTMVFLDKTSALLYTGTISTRLGNLNSTEFEKTLRPELEYQMPEIKVDLSKPDRIVLSEENLGMQIEMVFDVVQKKLSTTYVYHGESLKTVEVSTKTKEEIEQEKQEELKAQLEKLKQEESTDSFKIASYPDTLSDTKIVKMDDDLGKMIMYLYEATKAGEIAPEQSNSFVTKIIDTLQNNLKRAKKTNCSPKQYAYVIKYIKQVQKEKTDEKKEIEQKIGVDLLKVFHELYKAYGNKGIPGKYLNEIRYSKATTYAGLAVKVQEAVCDCICRYINQYQLDKEDPKYGYNLIPEKLRTNIQFLRNDKRLEDKLLLVYANQHNIICEDKDKAIKILQTVLNGGYYSPAQKRYLNKLLVAYDVYISTKNDDDVDKDADF